MNLPASTLEWVANALSDLRTDAFNLPARMNHVVMTGAPVPRAITLFVTAVDDLFGKLTAGSGGEVQLDDDEASLLRTAVAAYRREMAEKVYQSSAMIADPEFAAALEGMLRSADDLLRHDELRHQMPARRPRLSMFLNRSGVERILPSVGLGKREYDAKHQALLSVSLLLPDLERMRRECDERSCSLSVVFVDLDDFKSFNTEMGEVAVDRVVLPQVLRTVEEVVFGHGHAYRHGGDEFVLLLPNASQDVVGALVTELRRRLSTLEFPGTTLRARASAGAWISVPESHLAGAEVIECAARSKKAAKERGKGVTVIRYEWGSGHEETVVL